MGRGFEKGGSSGCFTISDLTADDGTRVGDVLKRRKGLLDFEHVRGFE